MRRMRSDERGAEAEDACTKAGGDIGPLAVQGAWGAGGGGGHEQSTRPGSVVRTHTQCRAFPRGGSS